MTPRYSRQQMVDIWSPETKFKIWFEIEAHATTAQAKLGVVPQASADEPERDGTPLPPTSENDPESVGNDDARRSLAPPRVAFDDSTTDDEGSLAPSQVDDEYTTDDEGSDPRRAPRFSGFLIRRYTHEPGSQFRTWLESSLSTGLTLVSKVCAVRRSVLTACKDFDWNTDNPLRMLLGGGPAESSG